MISSLRILRALLGWLLLTGVVYAADAPQGREVPSPLLERLQAQYVPRDAQSSNLPDGEKVHRYATILREGEFMEKAYAGAKNLYRVQEAMLNAAKGLATLEGSDEAQAQVLAIAQRILASDAPPQARLFADLLMTRE